MNNIIIYNMLYILSRYIVYDRIYQNALYDFEFQVGVK